MPRGCDAFTVRGVLQLSPVQIFSVSEALLCQEKQTNMFLPPTDGIMVFHPEFERAGEKAGLQVWRVESLELVPVPEGLYGGFYSGDAYIVLHTTAKHRGGFQYDLHFWLGTQPFQP